MRIIKFLCLKKIIFIQFNLTKDFINILKCPLVYWLEYLVSRWRWLNLFIYIICLTFAYLDNVTICDNDIEENNKNLNLFLEAAKVDNLTFIKDKCAFSVSLIDLLNYCVSHELQSPDPKHFCSPLNLPVPIDKRSLQQIVGMFVYYAKWILKFYDKIKMNFQFRTLKYNHLKC